MKRKINPDLILAGEWMPLEESFDRHFDTKTSHGMCPDCTKKHFSDVFAKSA